MNTWGISGPVFLALYGSALLVVAAAALWGGHRRVGASDEGTDGLDEYEVAMLNGGERLAAVVALVNLDRQGALELGDRLLRELEASGDLDLAGMSASQLEQLGVSTDMTVRHSLDPGADPVERAVYEAARHAEPRSASTVVTLATEASAFADLRADLEERGLLYPAEDADRLHHRWLWFLPLLAAGVLRATIGLQRGRPVTFLVVLLIVTVAATVFVARRRLVRTRHANRLLTELRREQTELPARAMTAGDASLGMALALAGVGALWLSDPPLALAMGYEAEMASTPHRWWGDGGAAGHGGGLGAAGYGYGAGCSGGGGGCGGGGGGCGGGGGGCSG